MIKANELRIGNYLCTISEEPEFIKIDSIDSVERVVSGSGIENIKLNDLEQVVITVELLLKLGFEKEVDEIGGLKSYDYYLGIGDELEIYSDLDGKKLRCLCVNNLEIEIKYLHQLQNLYFALTGEELEFNQH